MFTSTSLKLFSNILRGAQGSKIEGILQEVLAGSTEIKGFKSQALYGGESPARGPSKRPERVVVFCIDSGSYTEYDSVSKLGASSPAQVVYGGCEMSSGRGVLERLLGGGAE